MAWFEDPDRPGRLRLLGGADPSQSELWVILGRLEKRLAAKEEDLAEKNLTYEAIGRLVDALRVKTDANSLEKGTTPGCLHDPCIKRNAAEPRNCAGIQADQAAGANS